MVLEPDLTPERLGGYAKRRRILDSAPVQAFWTTRHPPDVDIDAVWNGVIRAGLTVIDAEGAKAVPPTSRGAREAVGAISVG